MVFATPVKVYSTVSTRRFISDLRDAADKGHLSRVIHHNSICAGTESAWLTPVLAGVVTASRAPLRAVERDFAVDSTGLSASRFVRWFGQKYGVHRTGHDWVKVHVMTGVRTNVVTAVGIRGRDASDAPLFRPLVGATKRHFTVGEVSAGKAYPTADNLEAVLAAGGTPYIPFRANASDARGGVREKMLLDYRLHRDEFKRHDHKRSDIESRQGGVQVDPHAHPGRRGGLGVREAADRADEGGVREVPPRKAPSLGECQFCPIAADDCAERVVAERVSVGETGDF